MAISDFELKLRNWRSTWFISRVSLAEFLYYRPLLLVHIYVSFSRDAYNFIFNLKSLLAHEAGALPFGRIFNLTLLRRDLLRPILEWSDVKYIPSPTSVESPPNTEREALGCWSTRPEYDPEPLRVNPLLNNLRLDVSFTRVPTSTRHSPNNPRDDFALFSKLVLYIFSHAPLQVRPLLLLVFVYLQMNIYRALTIYTSPLHLIGSSNGKRLGLSLGI